MSSEIKPSTVSKTPRFRTSTAGRGDRLHPSRFQRTYWHLIALRRALDDVIARHVAGKSLGQLADYGCGNMPYRPLFESQVGAYLGYDLPGNDLADGELDAEGLLPLPEASVDLVLSSQVLEHVTDPAAYLAECRRVLRSGGRLILSTHGVWRYHPDPNDFWRWTSEGMRKIIEDADLHVLEIRGVMAPASYALQLLQDAWLQSIPKFLRPVFFGGMQLLVQAADVFSSSRSRDRDACVFVVVAEPKRGEV